MDVILVLLILSVGLATALVAWSVLTLPVPVAQPDDDEPEDWYHGEFDPLTAEAR